MLLYMLADTILRWLGDNPAQYSPADKWPSIFAILFIYGLPFIFAILFLVPFIKMLIRKEKFTIRTTGKAVLHGIGFVILGVVGLFLLVIYLHDQLVKAVYGGQ